MVFFFQAEDGIRDRLVTGVQTCALPILADYLNINSGKFRIRQIDLNLSFNRGRDLKLKGSVDTQFGKAVIDGSFSIRQPVRYDSDLTIDKFTIVISNLT